METEAIIGETFEVEVQLVNGKMVEVSVEVDLIVDGEDVDNEVVDTKEVELGAGSTKNIDLIFDTEGYDIGEYDATVETPTSEDSVVLNVEPEPLLYTASSDGESHRIYHDEMELDESYTGHGDWVSAVYSDGDWVYTSSGDGSVHKLDPDTMEFEDSYNGHGDESVRHVWGDGEWLFTCGSDEELHKIDPETLELEDSVGGFGNDLREIAGAGDYVYVGVHFDGDTYKINKDDLSTEGSYHMPGITSSHIDDIFTNGDYVYIVNAREEGFDVADADTMDGHAEWRDADSWVYAIGGDENWVYSGESTGQVRKIDPYSLEQEGVFTPDIDEIIRSLTSDGEFVYAGSREGDDGPVLHKIDIETMERVGLYEGHSDAINTLWA